MRCFGAHELELEPGAGTSVYDAILPSCMSAGSGSVSGQHSHESVTVWEPQRCTVVACTAQVCQTDLLATFLQYQSSSNTPKSIKVSTSKEALKFRNFVRQRLK